MQRNTLIVLIIYLLVFAAVVWSELTKADNWFAEVGAGYAPHGLPWVEQMDDQHYSWKGSNPTALLAVGREFDNGITVQWQHLSNWRSGFPVNSNHETGLDHVVVSYKVRW